MNTTRVDINLTMAKLYWGAFAIGAGLLSGVAAVVTFASMVRSVARFIGLAS